MQTRKALPRTDEDPLIAEYESEILRFSQVAEETKALLKKETDPEKLKLLRKRLDTAYQGRAQLRRTLKYMRSYERHRTPDLNGGVSPPLY